MYQLRIFPFEIDGFQMNDFFDYIKSSCIPRESEIIEKVQFFMANDDRELNNYLLKVEVQSVHYELSLNNSVMPVVYGTVIEIKKVEEE